MSLQLCIPNLIKDIHFIIFLTSIFFSISHIYEWMNRNRILMLKKQVLHISWIHYTDCLKTARPQVCFQKTNTNITVQIIHFWVKPFFLVTSLLLQIYKMPYVFNTIQSLEEWVNFLSYH